MGDGDGDRRQIDSLLITLLDTKLNGFRDLLDEKFKNLGGKFDTYKASVDSIAKQLSEHVAQPHNLRAVAQAAAALPPVYNGRYSGNPVVRFLARWSLLHYMAAIGFTTGTGGILVRGCGYDVHIHTPTMLTAEAKAAVPTPTAAPAPTPKVISG